MTLCVAFFFFVEVGGFDYRPICNSAPTFDYQFEHDS